MIIVEPDWQAKHRDFVAVHGGGTGGAIFKHLMFEVMDTYPAALKPDFKPIKVSDQHDLHICGVVIRSEFYV